MVQLAILACFCRQDTTALLCPRLRAVTHSAFWESTQARIVLAWQEFFTRTEQGILLVVCWIPMTPAPYPQPFPSSVRTRLHPTVEGRQPSGLPITGSTWLSSTWRSQVNCSSWNRSVLPGGNPLVSGTILQQSSNGSFTVANLNGPAVFEVTALDPTGLTAQSQVGVFGASGGNGQFNLTSDQNTGGTLTSPCSGTLTQCAPGTDTVATNGRVTLTDSGFQNSSPPQTLQPVLYLVSNNQAFIIGTDPAVSFGFMTPQSGTVYTHFFVGNICGRVARTGRPQRQQRREHRSGRVEQPHRYAGREQCQRT